jgi:hypothetical protein
MKQERTNASPTQAADKQQWAVEQVALFQL